MVTNSEAARQLAALRKREERICPVCGATFEAFGKQKYDQKACANKASYRKVGRRRPSPGGHAFVPLSGSQDTSGRYTRCGVNGCDLSPEQHEHRPSPGGTEEARS